MATRNNRTPSSFVPLPPSTGQSLVQVSATVDQHTKDLARQEKILNWTFGFIVALLVICIIAFITFLLDAYKFHYEAYKENTKIIQELKKENYNLNIEQLNQKLQSLQKIKFE